MGKKLPVGRKLPGGKKLVVLALLFEGALALLGLGVCRLTETEILLAVSPKSLALGAFLALLLWVLQVPLYWLFRRHPLKFQGSVQFVRNTIAPFVRELTIPQALVVSAAAGLGEELLFRAALLPLIGAVGSSALFAVVHFGMSAQRYPFFLLCYFLISLGFCWQYSYTGDLVSVMLTHALYDFLAILHLKARALA